MVLDVTARLKVAYFEWLSVQKAIEITRKSSDLLSRFEEIARNRYTVGKGLQVDVLKAQLEVSSLEQQVAMLDEKRQRVEAEIASLLAVPNVALQPPGEVQPSSLSMSLDELLKATNPLPHFVETFMDDGYYDMYKIMKALREVHFDGIVILDHSPAMVGGNYAQTAYGFAYMRALLNRANTEAKV